jgi:hypothetical protein
MKWKGLLITIDTNILWSSLSSKRKECHHDSFKFSHVVVLVNVK